jgi:hypothetical protein
LYRETSAELVLVSLEMDNRTIKMRASLQSFWKLD